MLDAIETGVGRRFFGKAVRLEVDAAMLACFRDILVKTMELQPTRSTPSMARRWGWPI
ncbi:MAG: hypothetical protein KIS63_00870 [Caldilineales bacterium]|nr:hypothetical protein [Caldilineales bacterium]